MPVSPPHNKRRRSVGFLEHEGRSWACFLVTSPAEGGGWQGHFTFRPADAETAADEIRTSDIFLEAGDAEVQARARGLGPPSAQRSARFGSARTGSAAGRAP